MYLRAETIGRNGDDSLFVVPELVNLDKALRLYVVRDGSDPQYPLTLQVKYPDRDGPLTAYYFGPADMTDKEQASRFDALHASLLGGQPSVWWTKADDDEKRASRQPLAS